MADGEITDIQHGIPQLRYTSTKFPAHIKKLSASQKNFWGGCPTPSLCKNIISSAFYYNIHPRQADNERPIAEKTAYMPKDFEMGQYIGNFFIILHLDTFI
ncbi:MAG: hypothetical protein IKU22_11670 [Alistipes sp.]|nr:hypothetical protein [Alistipes sp.]